MATERIVTVKSSGGNYTSLAAAEAGEQGNLVSLDRQLTIQCYAMQAGAAVIDGSTTDSTRYIKVIVPETDIHDGKWNTSKYRIVVASETYALLIADPYTRVIGVQVTSSYAYSFENILVTASNCLIDRCISKDSPYYYSIRVAAGNCIVRNTLSYGGAGDGFRSYDGSVATFQNCSAIDNGGYGFRGQYDSFIATNCLMHGNTGADLSADSSPTVTYCASEDATADDWGGAGNRINQTFTFVNYAGDDFHLASNDAGARDYGTSLSGSFSTDIDGATRSGTWDIGADEYVSASNQYTENLLVTIAATAIITDIATFVSNLTALCQAQAAATEIEQYVESALATAGVTASVTDIKAFVETLTILGQADATVTEIAAFIESLFAVGSGTSTVADVQSMIETTAVVMGSSITASDAGSFTENLHVLVSGSSAVEELKVVFENLAVIGAASVSVVDNQSMVESLTAIGSGNVTAADLQTIIESVTAVMGSTAAVSETASYIESISAIAQATAVSSEVLSAIESLSVNVNAVASVDDQLFGNLFETLTAIGQISASISDIQNSLDDITAICQSGASSADIQMMLENAVIMAGSGASISELASFFDTVLSAAQAAASVEDVIHSSVIGVWVLGKAEPNRNFSSLAPCRSFESSVPRRSFESVAGAH